MLIDRLKDRLSKYAYCEPGNYSLYPDLTSEVKRQRLELFLEEIIETQHRIAVDVKVLLEALGIRH